MSNWSLHRRLVVTISVVFVFGAAVLLTLQYFFVREVVGKQFITTLTAAGQYDPCAAGDVECEALDQLSSTNGVISITESPGLAPDDEAYVESPQIQTVAQAAKIAVGNQLLIWSAATLAVLAIIAVGAAHWITSQALKRIVAVSNTARSITASDRSKRLRLDGPEDEIKSLADTINQMLERLDVALLRQEKFLAAASHELRTPNAIVRTSLEVPAVQGRFPEDVMPAVTRALVANQKSTDLLEALAALSAVQLTEQTSFSGDIEGAVAGVLQDCQGLADERGIVISMPELVESDADSIDGRLAAVAVGNLVRNAIIHNIADGEVWVTLAGDHVQVVNTGIEMAPAEVAELSEPFNRGRQTCLADGGMGLGLTVAQAVADHFGWTLTLLPRDGGGLSVTLSGRFYEQGA